MLVLILSCTDPVSEPIDIEWETPTFPGDGLPASEDTAHDTARGDTSGETTTTGSTTSSVQIGVTDGLFTWLDYGSYGLIGYLVLLTEPSTCGDILAYGAYPDGIFFYAYPPDDVRSSGWEAHYPPCGSPPCNQAFYFLSGEFGYVDGSVTIDSYDAHYLTTSWQTEVGSGKELTFYNCGDAAFWY